MNTNLKILTTLVLLHSLSTGIALSEEKFSAEQNANEAKFLFEKEELLVNTMCYISVSKKNIFNEEWTRKDLTYYKIFDMSTVPDPSKCGATDTAECDSNNWFMSNYNETTQEWDWYQMDPFVHAFCGNDGEQYRIGVHQKYLAGKAPQYDLNISVRINGNSTTSPKSLSVGTIALNPEAPHQEYLSAETKTMVIEVFCNVWPEKRSESATTSHTLLSDLLTKFSLASDQLIESPNSHVLFQYTPDLKEINNKVDCSKKDAVNTLPLGKKNLKLMQKI